MAKIDPDKINRILSNAPPKLQDNTIGIGYEEIDAFGNRESLIKMFHDIKNYKEMLQEQIVFVNDELTKVIPFTRENIYLICAYSGSGKSTIAANISYPLWKQGKKVMVISNEEPEADICFRIACLELGYNFNDYKKGAMPPSVMKECMKRFQEITKYVKIVDVNASTPKISNITATVEGVQTLLEAANNKDFSCVVIDYFQLLKKSVSNPSAKSYDVLNDFRIWLGQFIRRSNMPVVILAQLHSIGKRNNKDLDSRIKACPDIYEPSSVVIEVIPHFEDKISQFIVHKDRFGAAGKSVLCSFDKGRFVKCEDPIVLAKFKSTTLDEVSNTLYGKEEIDNPEKEEG